MTQFLHGRYSTQHNTRHVHSWPVDGFLSLGQERLGWTSRMRGQRPARRRWYFAPVEGSSPSQKPWYVAFTGLILINLDSLTTQNDFEVFGIKFKSTNPLPIDSLITNLAETAYVVRLRRVCFFTYIIIFTFICGVASMGGCISYPLVVSESLYSLRARTGS